MDNYKEKYEYLAEKVRRMLEAQKAYFKSNKDMQLLKISKAMESEVAAIVNPKSPPPVTQATLDWLGQ